MSPRPHARRCQDARRKRGPELYAAVGYLDDDAAKKKREKDKKALFGDD